MVLRYIAVFILILSSCINQVETVSKTDKNPDPFNPSDTQSDFSADYYAYQDVPYSLSTNSFISGLDPSKTYTYSLENGPSWSSINGANGVLTGTPIFNVVHRDIRAVATNVINPLDKVRSSRFSIGVYGDPLRSEQWHLKNTGQSTFSSSTGIVGIDINTAFAFGNSFLGQDIRIAVSDTGVEINHSDLKSNVLEGASKDYTLTPPYLGFPTPDDAHGTAVSGIIAAEAWNNYGVTGVAPLAKIAGFQFLSSAQTSGILMDQASGDFDIFNYSYGDSVTRDIPSDLDYLDQLQDMVTNGRGGLGSFFVKSAGNEFIFADSFSRPTVCAPHNSNAPFENESPYLLVVGAVDARGVKSTYSSAGSNIWVSAPGGEYGDSEPAILTTDLPTCLKGFSKATSNPVNPFEYNNALNSSCDFTSAMNGTSSAAPIVSGSIALILSANPNLTHREVKHILAMSAKKIDQYNQSFSGSDHPSNFLLGCPGLSLDDYDYEQGWVPNARGITYNNFYGFGMVDTEAAIKMARDFSLDPLNALPLPSQIVENKDFNLLSYRSSPGAAIPDKDAAGLDDTITINSALSFVETVQIRVSVDHARSGDIGIELTSPSGVKSILLNINNSFLIDGDEDLNITLASQAFYGEVADGAWTIKVIDGQEGKTGTLSSWNIALFGH